MPAAALVWPRSTTRTAHKKLRSPPRESRLATARASSHGPALTLINRNNDWRELLPRLAIVGGFVVYSTTLTRNTFEVEWQVQDLLQNNNDDPLHHLLLCPAHFTFDKKRSTTRCANHFHHLCREMCDEASAALRLVREE